jgi:hypothetical protein
VEPEAKKEIPEPPWKAGRPKRHTRTPLTREAIIEAALHVLERDGSDRLSAPLAEELGTGARRCTGMSPIRTR